MTYLCRVGVAMETNNKLRKKKIAIGFILIAIVCGVTASFILAMNYTPKFFREITDHKAEGVKIDYFKTMGKPHSVMVYYPVIDNALGETLKNEANKIFDEICSEEFDSEVKQVYTRVDYTMKNITSELVNVVFDITNLEDGNEVTKYKSVWFGTTGEVIDVTTIYDEQVLRLMVQKLRTECKQNSELAEIAYTREFLEQTAFNPEIFTNFVLVGNELVYTIDHLAPTSIEFRIDLQTVANHINMNFGIEQTVADPVIYMPERYVNPDRPMIAITFDDGPHVKNTPPILEALRRYDSAATFFIVGNRLNTGGSAVVFEAIESGSEIGSHSYNHPNMAKMKNMEAEFNLTKTKVYEDISQWCYEIKLFRPPYGAISNRMREESPYPFIMWSMDTLDWESRDAQSTVNLILEQVQDGDIILMHDIHAESKDAAIEVIPLLIDEGYQIVTVDEMMSTRGIEMENGKTYSRAR